MDFTKLTKWSDRARNFHEFLGDVLEGEREIVKAAPLVSSRANAVHTHDTHFEPRNDIENALLVASRGRAPITLETRFAALAPYFEAGFIFEQTELGETRLESMFLFGRVYAPRGAETRTTVPVPPSGFPGVLRGKVDPLLRAFRLQNVAVLHDADVFAISVRRGVVALLVCNRPHPWQVGLMEEAYDILTSRTAS
jgi:hypothetical protein